MKSKHVHIGRDREVHPDWGPADTGGRVGMPKLGMRELRMRDRFESIPLPEARQVGRRRAVLPVQGLWPLFASVRASSIAQEEPRSGPRCLQPNRQQSPDALHRPRRKAERQRRLLLHPEIYPLAVSCLFRGGRPGADRRPTADCRANSTSRPMPRYTRSTGSAGSTAATLNCPATAASTALHVSHSGCTPISTPEWIRSTSTLRRPNEAIWRSPKRSVCTRTIGWPATNLGRVGR